MRTLDSLVSAELPIPDVIKIDVEGEEERVLHGCLKTLSKFQPIVLCDYNDDTTLSLLSALLPPLDYEILPGPPVTGIPRGISKRRWVGTRGTSRAETQSRKFSPPR